MVEPGDKGLTSEKIMRSSVRSRSTFRPNLGDKRPDSQVASALRTAYEETVKEDVPAEFLDLLGKLS